ncbi:MAG: UDP-N-acetylmuramoyl-tripeptide--D-alanyl-D-alanine ligase [Fimbriimonadaceae bacterium]|nr:UDP-N-acetylmuramoyl-tripeptide--D-alanyl-D-alanine ligase [Fimbriimonadaceae bacterium]
MTIGDLARRLGGEAHVEEPGQLVKGFATDSREAAPGVVFLAIKGANVDGHDFVSRALMAGAVAVVVERPVPGPHVLVEDLVQALARFGRSFRSEFTGPVVGITGSNGKSTTKELVAAALAPLGPVLKNEGNRNTEFTSPLLWANLTPETRSVVVEMGMRGFGQIDHLASVAQPTVGLVTMVGTAHVEMVGSRAGIARAKAEMLGHLTGIKASVLPMDDDFFPELASRAPGPVRTFGTSPDAECRVVGYRAVGLEGCHVMGRLDGQEWQVELPMVGRHQANNVAAAILAAHTCGVPVQEAASAAASVEPMPMRMQVVERDGVRFLVDTYNASPDSTVAAMRSLADTPVEGRRLAVLGEMKELGGQTETGHRQVGAVLATLPFERVLLTGGATCFIGDEATKVGFSPDKIDADETLDLDHVRRFLASARPGDVVLLKGSRALGLERALEGTA